MTTNVEQLEFENLFPKTTATAEIVGAKRAPRMRPVNLDGFSVRRILSGDKTQFREAIRPQPKTVLSVLSISTDGGEAPLPFINGDPAKDKFRVGDLLWVRETWAKAGEVGDKIEYRADNPDPTGGKWRSATSLRMLDSRLLLQVTRVKIELFDAIDYRDAIAEGVERVEGVMGGGGWKHYLPQRPWEQSSYCMDPQASVFEMYLERQLRHRPNTGLGDWVWAVEFRVIKKGHEFKMLLGRK